MRRNGFDPMPLACLQRLARAATPAAPSVRPAPLSWRIRPSGKIRSIPAARNYHVSRNNHANFRIAENASGPRRGPGIRTSHRPAPGRTVLRPWPEPISSKGRPPIPAVAHACPPYRSASSIELWGNFRLGWSHRSRCGRSPRSASPQASAHAPWGCIPLPGRAEGRAQGRAEGSARVTRYSQVAPSPTLSTRPSARSSWSGSPGAAGLDESGAVSN
jgi:hypothetical protein